MINKINQVKHEIESDNNKLWLKIKEAGGDFNKLPAKLPTDAIIYVSPNLFEKIRNGSLILKFNNFNIDIYKDNLLNDNQFFITKKQ